PVYQKDIEAEFNIRRSTATRLLQAMEHKNLIMREPEENDGRLKRIRLTNKAMERSREVLDRISCIERQLVEGITAEEMKVLHSVCQRIRQNAERTGGDK
ncbi:MAG: MarR family transcriptional regulator, partial [Eubacteriales bacterium]|nr:MarR family transcriptional regulator [Eubacteriales bacterium]